MAGMISPSFLLSRSSKGWAKSALFCSPLKMQSPKEKEEPVIVYVVVQWLKPPASETQDEFLVCLCLGGSNLCLSIAMGVPQPQDCRWRWVEKAFLHSLVKLWDCTGKTKRFSWPFVRRRGCWGPGEFSLFIFQSDVCLSRRSMRFRFGKKWQFWKWVRQEFNE